MGIRRRLKRVVEQITGTHLLRNLPFGISVSHDLGLRFPGYHVDTIFDVGANIGQSALGYAAAFPSSKIYCFEPIGETNEQLQRNLEGQKQILCYNLAFSDSEGKSTMISNSTSTMNCFLRDVSDAGLSAQETEQVHVSTLDEFCKISKINRISYLKIDTEGEDLNVLIGARGLLGENALDMIEVEAGMNPGNKYHVPLERLKEYLESYSYFIFGIYEQVSEWPSKETHLRHVNTFFVSQAMIRNYSGK